MLTDIVICSGLAFKKYPWNSQTECEVLLHNVLDIVIRWISQLRNKYAMERVGYFAYYM